MPKNISAEDQKKLEQSWKDAAEKRNAAIARETTIPTIHSIALTYQLRKFGRHWVSYYKNEKNKYVPLLLAPSLGESAMNVLEARISDDIVNAKWIYL